VSYSVRCSVDCCCCCCLRLEFCAFENNGIEGGEILEGADGESDAFVEMEEMEAAVEPLLFCRCREAGFAVREIDRDAVNVTSSFGFRSGLGNAAV